MHIKFIRKSACVSKTCCYFYSKIANVSRFWWSCISHQSHHPSQHPSRHLRFFGLKHFRYWHRQHKTTLSTSLVKEPYALCFRFLQPSSRRSAVFVVRSMMKIPCRSKGRVMQCLWTCHVLFAWWLHKVVVFPHNGWTNTKMLREHEVHWYC